MITFTKHASDKFEVLRQHKFVITQKQVIDAIQAPDSIDYSRLPLYIAQKRIDMNHVLRVVYKYQNSDIKVITFYPGRRAQYEKPQ